MQIRAVLLLALLAACSTGEGPGYFEGNVVAPGNFFAGSGTIQSVGVLRNARPDGQDDKNLYRLYLHMDAGGFQSVDVDNSTFLAGEYLALTNDGRVVRLSGTSLNRQR